MDNLRNIDLNLLRTLSVLLEERNVTRAAERLHLSQPSVSIQLAKLRDILEDPLLLPGSRGMQTTARADDLKLPLQQALAALDGAIAPTRPFDPTVAHRTWGLAMTDFTEMTVILPTLPALRRSAPNSRLAITQVVRRTMEQQLETGDIDLAFFNTDDLPASLRQKTVFHETYVMAARIGHPHLKKRLSPAQFSRLDHVVVSPQGGGFVGPTDVALTALGLQRRVSLSVPHFTFVSAVLSATDMVAMLPSRLAALDPRLQVVKPPVVVPGFSIAMLWHERSHRDPSHQWLREMISAHIDGTS